MTTTPRSRSARRLGCLTIAVVALTALVNPSLGADAATAEFTLVSRADVATVQLLAKGAPLVAGGGVVFFTPGTAQTELAPVMSRGFSSAPYPGPFLLSLPGLVSGASGGKANVPNYPLFLESDSSLATDPAPITYGPYELAARSRLDGSVASAAVSPAAAPAWGLTGKALSDTHRAGGTFVAQSTATVDSFAVGPGVTVQGLRGTARLVATSSGDLVAESSFVPGTISIAGMTFGLVGSKLVAAGNSSPMDVTAASALLAARGITFEYVAERRTTSSVTGACLRIAAPVDLPGQPHSQMTVTLGEVSVSGYRSTTSSTPVSTEEESGTHPVAPVETRSGAGRPTLTPTDQPVLFPDPTPMTEGDPAQAVRTAGAPVVAHPQQRFVSSARRQPVDPPATGIYLLLVGAAAMTLLGSRLLGAFAIVGRLTGRRG